MANCKQCGKEIEAGVKFCTYCGATNALNGSTTIVKRRKKHRDLFILLYILGAFAMIVATVAILNANLLLPWQKGARRNKQVILEYTEEHYPDAQFIEGHYNSAKFFIWNNIADACVFNLDGVEFKIIAELGKIITDDYPKARACAQFDKIIQDGFLKPQGIVAQIDYRFSDNYEIYPYTGALTIKIKSIDQGSTPREVGWLYDFYKYWKNKGSFLSRYSVNINIISHNQQVYHIQYNDNADFPNEDSFYAAFKTGH